MYAVYISFIGAISTSKAPKFVKLMAIEEYQELIPGLPNEVAVECLTRSHYSSHHHASAVCRPWRRLLHSPDFHRLRHQTGHTNYAACLIQAVTGAAKPGRPGPPAFGISVFDSVTRTWDRVESAPKYPDRLPLFCHITSSQGKLIMMGGWDPETYDPVTDLFIYDFRAKKWARGRDMPEKRSLFAIGSVNGRVIIAGGHDDSKNALNSAWTYNIETDEWSELTRMTESRDECYGLVMGPDFWAVSGYETESQGSFKDSADVFDTRTGEWRRVEGMWGACQSPRSCVGTRNDGGLFSWAGLSPDVQVGTCAVELGDWALVCGSERYGSGFGFFMVERGGNGEYGEIKRLDVPSEFNGFVQSACCIEL
ncbi:hypothetical protein V2J09_013771 [Rumex salicifolius]